MWKWLLSLIGVEEAIPQDPWELSAYAGNYIGKFRKEFEDVAATLSQTMGLIQVRLNGYQAEFYNSKDEIVAQAVVHGECCTPCRVKVVFAPSFPESLKMTFDSVLPGRVHITALEYLNQW